MGSRKKKPLGAKNGFLKAYKALSLEQRIALKGWFYWQGRQRYSLVELKGFFDRFHPHPSTELLIYQSSKFYSI